MVQKYEEILDELGAFGAYQIRAFLLVNLIEMPVCWIMFSPILVNYKPTWHCPNSTDDGAGYKLTNYTSGGSAANFSLLNGSFDKTFGNVTVEKNKCIDGIACPGITFDTDLNSIVNEWLLICRREYISETITSVQMAGMLVGSTVAGQLADLLGRKKVLYIAYLLLVISILASSFSTGWIMYGVLRFLVGGLGGGVLVIAFVLPIELVSPRWRTFCGCIGFWSLGQMVLAGIGYCVRDWRMLLQVTAGLGILFLPTWWFVPESPRWLISRGRLDEAEHILERMATYNKKTLPNLRDMINKTAGTLGETPDKRKYSFWHLFSSKQLTKQVIVLTYCWFVASMVYYGISFNTGNLAGSVYVNMCISGLVELPALVFVVCVQNRLGRRLTVSILIGLCGIFTFSFLILDLTDSYEKQATMSLVFAMIGKAGVTGGYDALAIYTTELYPTVIRNIGYSAAALSARIGGIVAPQLVLLASESGLTVPFTIFGVASIVFVVLIWFLPETNGKPLPDTLKSKTINTHKGVQNEDNVEDVLLFSS